MEIANSGTAICKDRSWVVLAGKESRIFQSLASEIEAYTIRRVPVPLVSSKYSELSGTFPW
ncbi:MAG: hypothetical protein ACD_34C00006G0003 [uncultured bacterium]|nr:MAG: hypothetical protein ACD_34C00006G0003 [uncultured bacterium]